MVPAGNLIRKRALQGAAISVGSPLGWIFIRLIGGASIPSEILDHPVLFAYLFIGSLAAFSIFGAILGRSEERLVQANLRLDELSITDSLTGLRNVRHFRERLNQELSRSGRTGQPLALLMVDLDAFKPINDRFGHPAGDRVLEAVGASIRACVREIDTAARVGGEEFAILLPSCDAQRATQAAERVVRAVSEIRVSFDGKRISTTASAGAASTADLEHADAQSLYAAADQALYRAKRLGGNRVAGRPE